MLSGLKQFNSEKIGNTIMSVGRKYALNKNIRVSRTPLPRLLWKTENLLYFKYSTPLDW